MRARIAIGAAALAAAVTAHGASAGRIDTAFRSRALQTTLHFIIKLPDGYDRTTTRYPVVYFLHGLPAGPTAYRSVTWVEAALDRTGKPAILVVPQGTKTQNGDPEYHDWGPGRNWATALADELPAFVDAHYRTIASRTGRAIIGVSAGGYGAASLGLTHPGRFSAVESWSGYFAPTDPAGDNVLDLGTSAENNAASVHARAARLRDQFTRHPTFFGFYVGRSDKFLDENVRLNQELDAAGVPHRYKVYPGRHDVALWGSKAQAWLRLALNRLSAPR
jgi:enterochelin esterase-like enzyme